MFVVEIENRSTSKDLIKYQQWGNKFFIEDGPRSIVNPQCCNREIMIPCIFETCCHFWPSKEIAIEKSELTLTDLREQGFAVEYDGPFLESEILK